jgi:hypothetical protein
MATLILSLLTFTILYFLLTRLLGIFVLNIVGLPGALISLNSKTRKEPRYLLGLTICLIGHIYVYTSFIIYLIIWVKLKTHNLNIFYKYSIWIFCLITIIKIIKQIYLNAQLESNQETNTFKNPQIESLFIVYLLSFVIFFTIIFFPKVINPLWIWIIKIGYPF